MPRTYKRWTPEDIGQLETLYSSGSKVNEISELLGRDKTSVHNKVQGLKLRRQAR